MNHGGQPMAGDLENTDNANPQADSSSSNHQDTSEKRWICWLVPALVVANVAMFIFTMYINNCPKNENASKKHCYLKAFGRFSFQPVQENPLFGPSSSTLEKLGALEWDKVVHGLQGWRLVSCLWLHAGATHLLSNMFNLLLIGIGLEQKFGFVRIAVIYLVSGFGGSVLSALFIKSISAVGSSSPVAGLVGAMFSEIIINWTMYSKKATVRFLAVVISIACYIGFGIFIRVDNFAPIGGLLTGFLLGFVVLLQPQFGLVERRNLPVSMAANSKHMACQNILWVVSLVLLNVGFIVGLVMLFLGVNAHEYCHWCHHLSCVPNKIWHCASN